LIPDGRGLDRIFQIRIDSNGCRMPGMGRTVSRFVPVVASFAAAACQVGGSLEPSATVSNAETPLDDTVGDTRAASSLRPEAAPGRNADASSTDLPIKHVVVIVKENHTFDNYFGTFPGAEGSTVCKTPQRNILAPHAPNRTPRDLCHKHACALQEWDGGKMDGWLDVPGTSKDGDDLFCAQYGESDLPHYWAYAKTYALADHFFANELGPSFPGHMFLLAAQAAWTTDNPTGGPYWGCDQLPWTKVNVLQNGSCSTQSVFPCFDIPSVPTLLPSGVDWRFYGTNFYLLPKIWSMFDAIQPIRQTSAWSQVVNASTFDSDVQAGTLPAVTWLVDEDLNDEHPRWGGVCQGENWTVKHVNALMASPIWNDTVIFFTMDDFGGWYDHVAPPRQYGCDATQPYGLGFRLPLIVMSPYVKPGVYKKVAEQASIVKFILEVFKAPMFLADVDPAAQDKQANDLMDMFDWSQTPRAPLEVAPRDDCP
jgi:phospholipase C